MLVPHTSASAGARRIVACPKDGVLDAGATCPVCGGKIFDVTTADGFGMVRDLRRVHLETRLRNAQIVAVSIAVGGAYAGAISLGLAGLFLGAAMLAAFVVGKAVARPLDALRGRAEPAPVRALERLLADAPPS